MEYREWFRSRTGNDPWGWQAELGADPVAKSRLIRIPTGFGKTHGVLAAWSYHRVQRGDVSWPTRLVWALPMRVLVEQTIEEARKFLPHGVEVHALMGGVDGGDWHLHPERPAVLVGTQDMLLSRALNRGYAAPRARWPMEFGFLEQDALWVLDEVQLMGVGLATTAQLQTYRGRRASLRPCATWWMSATLQRSWLESVDSKKMVSDLELAQIPPAQQTGHLWTDVEKPCAVEKVQPESWAQLVAERVGAEGRGKLTLVVVNTVDAACKLHAALLDRWSATKGKGKKAKEPGPTGPELRLVHSRFRWAERAGWVGEFLRRDAPMTDRGRVIVATQVVEAGVDLDAALLITELAPWPSLVQRFGRAARRGGRAPVLVLDREPKDEKAAAPYTQVELAAARTALKALSDVAPASLEAFESSLLDDERRKLYPYEVEHLLLEKERLELFDTTADLTGADLDVSRFIRTGDERDVLIFWREIESSTRPAADIQASRAELCAVPFLRARDWIFVKKSNAFNPGKRAWVWDWTDGVWKVCGSADVVPGRTLLVSADSGGYDPHRGFDASSKVKVSPVDQVLPTELDIADNAQDQEDLSAYPWRTIGTHGRDVASEGRAIGVAISMEARLIELLELAGQLHDLGKSHPAFQGSIGASKLGARPDRKDLAKAPKDAWAKRMYSIAGSGERRPGFRHELASALALFAVLRRRKPDHPALLGPWVELLRALGAELPAAEPGAPSAMERKILALSAEEFDLVAYLVMSHHGKVRTALHSSPSDQVDLRAPRIRGVCEGDVLPSVRIEPDADPLPALVLTLEPASLGFSKVTGASWADRTQALLDRWGPGPLAFLEAWLRAADVRASRAVLPTDPLLEVKA
ncbi:MAG: CRISPR-associated endonuclease Cas3'' [Deltaproteobacteria bacterium]|nr:CRISPR-associated endonuclease Cas3'' [Deltaproteobacteria bacterium]